MEDLVVFFTPDCISHRTPEESLSIGYLASVLKAAGYRVRIVDGWLQGLTQSQIIFKILKEGSPKCVCCSSYLFNLKQASKIVLEIKRINDKIPIICGGYGPTFYDKLFLKSGFDIAVRGEAEHIITSLIVNLKKQNLSDIPNISYMKGGELIRNGVSKAIENLDCLPFPDRASLQYSMKRKNPINICSSRGCNGNCVYCSVSAFSKISSNLNWRGRSIENIVNEISILYKLFNIENFKFVDDSFIEPPRDEIWVEKFADQLNERNLKIRFRTQLRADRINNKIIKKLKKAGLFATSIGIENGSPTALKRMNKSANIKDNIRALRCLYDNQIYVQMGMILFDNKTTIGELAENYNFLKEFDWVITKGVFSEMYAAEGTNFTANLKNNNCLKKNSCLNYEYEIEDKKAKRVYCLLKEWHFSHAMIYDKIIDPISAPKVLTDNEYKRIYELCNKVVKNDVYYFGKVLDQIKNNREKDSSFLKNEIEKNKKFYEEVEQSIDFLYHKFGLNYDGFLNPFLFKSDIIVNAAI